MAEADPYARINTALERIDAVLTRPDPEVEKLRERHARLRARVEEAVAALDALTAEPPPQQGGDDGADAADAERIEPDED